MKTLLFAFALALLLAPLACAVEPGSAPPAALPASCDLEPSYECPACSVHSCEPGLWATSRGEEFRCTPNDNALGFPNLSCYDAQLDAAAACGC